MSVPVLPDEEAACDRCGKPDGEDIMWSHAWQQWLCLICRAVAAETEFRMTLAEKRALDVSAAEAV